jgi:hypothetical protein
MEDEIVMCGPAAKKSLGMQNANPRRLPSTLSLTAEGWHYLSTLKAIYFAFP